MKSEPSRTFIGSVVCVDLVGYSLRSIEDQNTIKQGFNRLLASVVQDVPTAERIILDTGDGAAVTFLGDPDECLNVALEMRDVMNAAAEELGARPGEGPVRIGISLGPLKLAVDLNNRPNIVGDGLNVAALIASFAQPGQIAASRPFHDMVSRLSPAHQAMFRFEGKHVDRNAREHQVYLVEDRRRVSRATGEPNPVPPPAPARPQPAVAPPAAPASSIRIGWKSLATIAVLLLAIVAGASWVLMRELTAPRVASTPPAPAPVETKPAVAPVPAHVPPPEPPKPAPEIVVPAPVQAPASPPAPVVEAAPVKPPPPKVETPPKAVPERATPTQPPPPPAAPAPVNTPATASASAIPIPVRREPVSFPRAALAQGVASGVVKARLAVDAQGRVTDVQIVSSNPPRIFDREAARALKEWLFNPGAAQRSYEVEIEFKQ